MCGRCALKSRWRLALASMIVDVPRGIDVFMLIRSQMVLPLLLLARYGTSLRYAGHHDDVAPADASGTPLTTIVAIDAVE